MKSLEDVFRIENDHVIIDCCPRNGDTTLPIRDDPNWPLANFEYRPDILSFLHDSRSHYTFYLNIAIVSGLIEGIDRDRCLEVTCPVCHTVYKITNDFLSKKLQH